MAEDVDLEFTPATLRQLAKETEAFRHRVLYSLDDAGADPVAAQSYLLALGALEQAQRHFAMAELFQLAGLRG